MYLHPPLSHVPTHPSPRRSKARGVSLLFCLLGAPAAWGLQFGLAYGLSAYACGNRTASWIYTFMLIISVIAALVAIAAGWVGWRIWRETSAEGQGPASHHHLLEIGEGRTRFLAMAGLLTSLLFLMTLLFTSVNMVLVPFCR